jgi:hypothetical protein
MMFWKFGSRNVSLPFRSFVVSFKFQTLNSSIFCFYFPFFKYSVIMFRRKSSSADIEEAGKTEAKKKSGGKVVDPKLEAKAKQKEKQKKLAEEAKKQEILKRQEEMMKAEINQTWKIAMGTKLPEKMKDLTLIQNVTRRNVWMEDNYVFNQIKSQFPNEVFHSIDKYVLRWLPPGSNFQVIVPLNDSKLQENAILMVNQLLPLEQDRVIFQLTTLDPTLTLFAEKIHPASLVSYRTKIEVLKNYPNFFFKEKLQYKK